MIRSGEHELWDAHMACGRARAEREALLAAHAPLARAMQRLGRAAMLSCEQAARAMGKFAAEHERVMRKAAGRAGANLQSKPRREKR